MASNVVDNAKWIQELKPELKEKIKENISIRANASVANIDAAITQILRDDVNIQRFILSRHQQQGQIPSICVDPSFSKQTICQMVDEWKGPQNLYDRIEQVQQCVDGWWNRHKFVYLSTFFFAPLLGDTLHEHVHAIVGSDCVEVQNVMYFAALHRVIHAHITWRHTRQMPLIPKQAFIPKQNMSSDTVQGLLQTLGARHGVPYGDGRKITRGEEAYNLAKRWANDILRKVQTVYSKQLQVNLQRTTHSNSNDDEKYKDTPAAKNNTNDTTFTTLPPSRFACVCDKNAHRHGQPYNPPLSRAPVHRNVHQPRPYAPRVCHRRNTLNQMTSTQNSNQNTHALSHNNLNYVQVEPLPVPQPMNNNNASMMTPNVTHHALTAQPQYSPIVTNYVHIEHVQVPMNLSMPNMQPQNTHNNGDDTVMHEVAPSPASVSDFNARLLAPSQPPLPQPEPFSLREASVSFTYADAPNGLLDHSPTFSRLESPLPSFMMNSSIDTMSYYQLDFDHDEPNSNNPEISRTFSTAPPYLTDDASATYTPSQTAYTAQHTSNTSMHSDL